MYKNILLTAIDSEIRTVLKQELPVPEIN